MYKLDIVKDYNKQVKNNIELCMLLDQAIKIIKELKKEVIKSE